MTSTTISPARPALSRWLALAACVLTGFRIGLDLTLLTGVTGVHFGVSDVVLQVCAMAIVASMVLRGVRGWLGVGVACLAYSIVVALVQLPAHPTRWTALLLTHHTVLIATVLALWIVGIERPPPNRARLWLAVAAGVAVGAVTCVALARALLSG